jgi:uncharacterized protein
MKPRIAVFGKHPKPGNVKTRLASLVGPDTAVAIYQALIHDLMAVLMQLAHQADIEIHLDTYSDFFSSFPFPQRLQQGEDLGAKLLFAMNTALAEGAPAVAVIGSDPVSLEMAAVEGLLRAPGDVVFGPAADGGYWGILARKTHPALFDGVVWSAPDTLATSLQAAERCGLSTAVVSQCRDLDTFEDLMQLREAVRRGETVPGKALADTLRALEPQLLAADGKGTNPVSQSTGDIPSD